MKHFGLIGFPLSHSFSKNYFEEKFKREGLVDCTYNLFELKSIDALPLLLHSSPGLTGLNVTIPYKECVIEFLDELDEKAKAVGAVNCITIRNGILKGYNTDVVGFAMSLKRFLNSTPDQVFVLGTGGASKAVCFVLCKMGLPFVKISRKKIANNLLYDEIPAYMKNRNLFINTTPLGMFPDVSQVPPIPLELLTENDFLFDLIYNPAETEFLKRGKEKGCAVKNGLEMLELQAEKSWEIWNS